MQKFNVSGCLFGALKIWASAWFAFLISMVPLYIWRGVNHASAETVVWGQDLIMTVCGLLFGFLILTLLQARDDTAERMEMREAALLAGGAAGVHLVAGLVFYAFNPNNIAIAVNGYFLGCLFGVNADGHPTFPSSLASALIFGGVYACAILVGTHLARRRRRKHIRNEFNT